MDSVLWKQPENKKSFNATCARYIKPNERWTSRKNTEKLYILFWVVCVVFPSNHIFLLCSSFSVSLAFSENIRFSKRFKIPKNINELIFRWKKNGVRCECYQLEECDVCVCRLILLIHYSEFFTLFSCHRQISGSEREIEQINIVKTASN